MSKLKIFNINVKDAKDNDNLNTRELKTLLDESGDLIPKQYRGMLSSILGMEELVVEDIMTPTSEVIGIDIDLGYFEWSLSEGEGEGSARVDDLAYNALEDSIDADGVLVPLIELGVSYRVTGPNLFSFGDWKLIPRDTSDVVRLGCMDSAFPNYDALASEDDGSCANIEGCMDPLADNYNSNATFDDGSCVISGCIDPLALNYNSNTTVDDNSCYYTLPNIIINEIHKRKMLCIFYFEYFSNAIVLPF